MSAVRSAIVGCAFLCVLGIAPDAHAQRLDREQIERFQALSAQGAELYEQGDYEGAIERLREARKIYDHPDLGYNIGRALAELGECSEARDAFEVYLAREGLDEAAREAAKQQLGGLDSCVSAGVLAVDCNVPSATVSLVEQNFDVSCDARTRVPTGTYDLQATASGYDDWSQKVEIEEGEETEVEVRLSPSKAMPVAATPSSGRAPQQVDARKPPVLAYSMIAGGIIVLAGGVAIDATSLGRAAKLEEAAGDTERLEQIERAGRTTTAVSAVFYGVGVAAIGTGVVLLLTRPSETTKVSLFVRPDGIGIAGSW